MTGMTGIPCPLHHKPPNTWLWLYFSPFLYSVSPFHHILYVPRFPLTPVKTPIITKENYVNNHQQLSGNDIHEQAIKRAKFLLCVDKTTAVQDVEEQTAADGFYLYMNLNIDLYLSKKNVTSVYCWYKLELTQSCKLIPGKLLQIALMSQIEYVGSFTANCALSESVSARHGLPQRPKDTFRLANKENRKQLKLFFFLPQLWLLRWVNIFYDLT